MARASILFYSMVAKIISSFSALMLLAGLLGFFVPNILYLVQFDLWQSFIYTILGAIGLKLGLSKNTTPPAQQWYLASLAVVSLTLLTLGIFWPNLADIIHLEVPEHFWHGAVGLLAVLAWEKSRKNPA